MTEPAHSEEPARSQQAGKYSPNEACVDANQTCGCRMSAFATGRWMGLGESGGSRKERRCRDRHSSRSASDTFASFQRVVDLYADAHARLASRDLNRPDIVLMCIPDA